MTATKVAICVTGERGTTGTVNPLYRPIVEGIVVPWGIELVFQESRGLENDTSRMLEGAYDVAEMSMATWCRRGRRIAG